MRRVEMVFAGGEGRLLLRRQWSKYVLGERALVAVVERMVGF